MLISGFDHISLLVADVDRALDFYHRLLGLAVLPRPHFAFAGAWLDLGGGQSLHLLCLPNPDAQRCAPDHVGRDQHLALRVASIALIRQQLTQAGISFTMSRSGRDSVFCRDPDGYGIEFVGMTAERG